MWDFLLSSSSHQHILKYQISEKAPRWHNLRKRPQFRINVFTLFPFFENALSRRWKQLLRISSDVANVTDRFHSNRISTLEKVFPRRSAVHLLGFTAMCNVAHVAKF